MKKYTYRMPLSSRQNLGLLILKFMYGKSGNRKISGLAESLRGYEFAENEELVLWKRMGDLLLERRRSDRRDELIEKVSHAILSIEQPGLFEPSYQYKRALELAL